MAGEAGKGKRKRIFSKYEKMYLKNCFEKLVQSENFQKFYRIREIEKFLMLNMRSLKNFLRNPILASELLETQKLFRATRLTHNKFRET